MDDFDPEKNKKSAYNSVQMSVLNRWERFEKMFPFYRMDVNGFMKLVNDAKRITVNDPKVPLYKIKYVTLIALQQAFAKNDLWSNELRDCDGEN